MFTRIVLLAIFCSLTLGDQKLNQYVDGVLQELPLQAMVHGVDPLKIPPFQFVVKGENFTELDLEVKAIQGSVSGLSRVTRRGNCSRRYFGSDFGKRLSCFLTLDPVRTLLNLDVAIKFHSEMDDTAVSMTYTVRTSTHFENESFVLLQLSEGRYPGYTPFRRADLHPSTITSSVTRGVPFVLKTRFGSFAKQLNAAVAEQLSSVLPGKFFPILNNILKERRFD